MTPRNKILRLLLGGYVGGGLLHTVILAVQAINCSCAIQKVVYFKYNFFLLTFVGAYLSITEAKGWGWRYVSVIFVMLAFSFGFQWQAYGSTSAVIENNLWHFALSTIMFGYLGAFTRVVALNPKVLSQDKLISQTYDQALNYRMHPVMRFMAGSVGTMFVSSAFYIPWDLARSNIDDLSEVKAWMLLLAAVMLILMFAMGLLFLAYAITGKTPKLILRYIKRVEGKE
ncbi:MAG: hypothetical protein ACLGG7_07760 [Bacteriovoracia bacterium]